MDVKKYGNPEIWGYCSGYDYVALCQLFGTMMDLPAGWPHFICDLQQVFDERGITDDTLPEQEGSAHNALDDARYIKRLWQFLEYGDNTLVGYRRDGTSYEAGDVELTN
jgi:hypothetical protein